MTKPSLRRNGRPVTGSAHLRVLLDLPSRIETWPVRIDVPAAQCRMAGEAVLLDVTPDACLQALAGGLAMPGAEENVEVVVSSPQLAASTHESRRRMTRGTETGGVVAVAAVGLTAVCRGRMARQEPARMVARRSRGVRAVTLQAVRSGVTARAGGGGGRRRGGVTLRVVRPV